MKQRSPKTDWSQTNTYISGGSGSYNLFGLKGDNCHQIAQWWSGDVSRKPPEPPQPKWYEALLTAALVAVTLLAGLGLGLKPEQVPGPLRDMHSQLTGLALSFYGVLLLLGLGGGLLWALKVRLFPSPADRQEDERNRQKRAWEQNARELTVVLRLGRSGQADRRSPPHLVSRDRHSPPMTVDALPRDRAVFVTLKDLTDEEYAYLFSRLGFMDI